MSNTIATDSLFSADERDALKILVGMIIPASAVHNVPGADDELIFADILDSAKANEAQIRKCVEHAVSSGLGDGLPLEQVLPELESHPVMAPLVSLVCNVTTGMIG